MTFISISVLWCIKAAGDSQIQPVERHKQWLAEHMPLIELCVLLVLALCGAFILVSAVLSSTDPLKRSDTL